MSELELGREEPKEMVWDEDYDDPSADMIFVSSDEVHFRAHSWHLKKKSGFAADMFEVANQVDSTGQPLQLDTSARVLRIFFDALFSSGKPVIDSCHKDVDDLLALADKFQSPSVENKILDALVLSPLVGKNAKRSFILAAKKDKPALAKRAVGQLNGSRLGQPMM